MKAKQTLIFCGSIAVGLAACVLADDKLNDGNATAPAKPKQEWPASTITNAAAASDFPVIVYIERRGQTITVKAGPNGPVYSVKTVEGNTLFENLSAEQLHARAPEVAQFMKTAVATGSGKSGVVIDARLDARIR